MSRGPRLVCDDRVLMAREVFGADFELRLLPAEAIDRGALLDADVLVVRSTTRVNDALVEGTRLSFVASATVGHDHVDREALARRGLGFAWAGGSSAASVAEFTWSAILVGLARCGADPRGRRLGVVGAGAIGERVARIGEALGLAVLRIDPPRRETLDDAACHGPEALEECDLVSLHVPLVRGGPHPTAGLVDREFLARLPEGSFLVNTSRGAVVRTPALAEALETGALLGAALDVWEGEPALPDLLRRGPALTSPHVAGRSLEGLAGNTGAVRDALRARFGLALDLDPRAALPAAGDWPGVEGPDAATALDALIGHVALDRELKRGGSEAFRALRDREPPRRDPSVYRLTENASDELRGLQRAFARFRDLPRSPRDPGGGFA